jgi:hypothetical protein
VPVYQISGWDANFENSRSREIEHPAFVIMPNKQHGMGFQRILGQHDGVAMFGLWVLILQACSRQRQNTSQHRDGWLTDDGAPTGTPWDADDLALRWKVDVAFVQRALELFAHPKVGWLRRYDSADQVPTRSADDRQKVGRTVPTEQNRTERNRRGAAAVAAPPPPKGAAAADQRPTGETAPAPGPTGPAQRSAAAAESERERLGKILARYGMATGPKAIEEWRGLIAERAVIREWGQVELFLAACAEHGRSTSAPMRYARDAVARADAWRATRASSAAVPT